MIDKLFLDFTNVDEHMYRLVEEVSSIDLRGKQLPDIEKFLSVCKEKPEIIEQQHDNSKSSIYIKWMGVKKLVFNGTLYLHNRGGVPIGAKFDDE